MRRLCHTFTATHFSISLRALDHFHFVLVAFKCTIIHFVSISYCGSARLSEMQVKVQTSQMNKYNVYKRKKKHRICLHLRLHCGRNESNKNTQTRLSHIVENSFSFRLYKPKKNGSIICDHMTLIRNTHMYSFLSAGNRNIDDNKKIRSRLICMGCLRHTHIKNVDKLNKSAVE